MTSKIRRFIFSAALELKRLAAYFRCVLDEGHKVVFVENLYGDRIIEAGWNRSLWRCSACKTYFSKPQLHVQYKTETNLELDKG